MARVYPTSIQVSGMVNVGTVQNPITVSSIQNAVTVSSVQNPVTAVTYHLKYDEYTQSVTLAANATSATASVTFADVARLVSVRAYSSYTPYTLSILDSNNNIIYQYSAQSEETVVVDGSVNVVLPKSVTIQITVSTAPSSNQTITVALGVLETVQA